MELSSQLSRRTAYFAAFLSVSALAFYAPLRQLAELALSSDSYSHILFIPFISIALIWINREQILPSLAGSPKLASGVALLGVILYGIAWSFAAALSSTDALELKIFAFLCLVWSGFLLFYGSRAFHAGLFPLLFLLLMIPIPDDVLEAIIEWLQVRSADLTYWIFRLTGTPVIRHGVLLAVPGVTIRVAEECSGIRSSTALFVVCMVGGYLLLRTPWARLVLLAAVLPVSILKNGIRIATLTLLAVHVDPGFLTGNLHHDGGFVFFGLGLLMLLPVLWWLQRLEDAPRHRALSHTSQTKAPGTNGRVVA